MYICGSASAVAWSVEGKQGTDCRRKGSGDLANGARSKVTILRTAYNPQLRYLYPYLLSAPILQVQLQRLAFLLECKHVHLEQQVTTTASLMDQLFGVNRP